jgi:hypothetical protein
MAIFVESILLGWPAPIPSVDLFFAKTIALDLTCLQTFQVKKMSSKISSLGFILDTTL